MNTHRISATETFLRRTIQCLLLQFLALILLGCASAPELAHNAEELSLPTSHAAHWEALAAMRTDDWFHVLNAGDEALDWRLRAIDSAVESVDLQTFIWKMDTPGKLVRQHLLAAAARGVRVRIMLDDSFTAKIDQELLDINCHSNVELKIFNPYPVRNNQAVMRVVLNAGDFARLDHRMHNKLMVVDGRAAIIGGRNAAAEYFGHHPDDNFRDMELITAGKIVNQLSTAFDDYWNNPFCYPMEQVAKEERRSPRLLASGSTHNAWHTEENANKRLERWTELAKNAHTGEATLLIDTPPQSDTTNAAEQPEQLGQALLEVLREAKSDAWLISPYLIPTKEFEAALWDMRKRGVRIRILTNSISSNNHLAAHSVYANHLKELVTMGAEVHEVKFNAKDRRRYMDSPIEEKWLSLHAKVLLVDNNLVFVGSPNLDARSLKLNTEMGLLIDSPSLNQELRDVIEPDFAPRNAWQVSFGSNGKLIWSSEDEVVNHQPTHSFMRRLEDWFLAHLPIEGEM